MKTIIFFCCFLGLIYCNVTLAQGYDSYGPWGCGWGYYNQPSLYSYESIPYYALHPPVYYYSVQPQIIKNEHIEEASPPSDQYQTHAPLRIPNPYVEQSGDSSMSKGAKWENKKMPKPLVVYPAAVARMTR
jgi:hypothetical protein